MLVLAIFKFTAFFWALAVFSPSGGEAEVRALPAAVLAPKPESTVSRDFIEAYHQSIERWGRIVAESVQPVPGHDHWSYLGLPRHVEDHVRPTAYAAMVLAFLAEFQPPKPSPDPDRCRAMRTAAKALLRYLTASHVTGGGTCLDGKPWGKQWQSAMWARAAGMAGWLVWPHLDKELQGAVARLVEFEADRFLEAAPKSSRSRDTGAEENAWNASITALACVMMPDHARAEAWEAASKKYMYNTFSVAADAEDSTIGDNGRLIREWVTTVNAHDDFTVENHGLVHVGYLKNAASELQENAIHWLLAGREVPRACHHHMPEVFQVLMSCMAWDGAAVYFAGNDWKLYHTQATDIVLYAMRSLLTRDARAAYLEKVALDRLQQMQEIEEGYYNVRRDLEYGGLCATRLIACCLAHGVMDTKTEPLTPAEFDRSACGVTHLAEARAVLHRTPDKFASFAWAQKRMALALPRDGSWVVWPHFSSYLGIINGKDSSDRNARLEKVGVETDPNGFRVTGTLVRCEGKIAHDFFYASPPGDFTVYIERLQPSKGFPMESRETGVIGLEYALGRNSRLLHGQFGTRRTTGLGGRAGVHALQSDWLNIDDRVGYVVRRTDGQKNVMRHHDESAGSGRVPKLQEWLSLVGSEAPTLPQGGSCACVITFLNQKAGETAGLAPRVRLTVQKNRVTCRIGDETIEFDFPDPTK